MSLLIDSGIDTCADLLGILPADVRDRIDPILLDDSATAGALRLLASLKYSGWHRYVNGRVIDWDGLLNYGSRRDLPANSSARVRIELAASLDGFSGAQPDLRDAVHHLDGEAYAAVLDALRIANEGLEGDTAVKLRHVRHGEADYSLITVTGTLDQTSDPGLRAAVKDACTTEHRAIAIDLTAATVHGRFGMSPLVGTQNTCRASGRALYLVAPPAMVNRVLSRIAGEPLPTFATVSELNSALAGAR